MLYFYPSNNARKMSNLSLKNLPDCDLYKKVVEKLDYLFFLCNSNGMVYFCSKAEYENTDQVQSLLDGADKKKLEVLLQSTFVEDSSAHEFAVVINESDRFVPHLCKVACLRNCAEEGPIHMVVFENIENRILLEKSLQKAKKKAEIKEELKSSFLVNMSHEIRTPMNSIIGFAELIQDSNDEEEKKEYIEIIRSSGQYLLNIIDDILDISRVNTNNIKIQVNRVHINNLIKELVRIYRSSEKLQEGVEIHHSLELNDENDILLTDNTRLRQVLSNLLDNAVKFTKKGSITIGYEIFENNEVGENSTIRFFVRDTGIGIPLADQDLIFSKYHQVRIIDQNSGAGLGLAIVEALVSAMGGKIKLKSELGKGSEFSFDLQCLWRPSKEESRTKNLHKLTIPDLSNYHILIAEDTKINYLFLINLLKKSKVKTSWAKNGKEAVEFVLEDHSINLVLMDMKMPVMDGYTASKHIKSLNSKLPIIAVTAYAMHGDMERAIVAGCDDYLSKPLNVEELFSKLKYFLER
jgi:signal transduction histidine kinase